ncbi:MAG: hypothetical protein HUJ76_02520 [Parasporobacterium sp.]|nr:hypothetical protein [Parasporobacterium sp.]
MRYDNEYRNAMENGFILYHTGLYPAEGMEEGTKHIGINRADAQYYSREHDPGENCAYFIRDCMYSPRIYGDMKNNMGIKPHLHFASCEGNVTFDDSDMGTYFRFGYLHEFRRCERGIRKSILEVKSREDYQVLKNMTELFSERGIIENPMFYLENECRFTGICTLEDVRRLDIDGEHQVYPCGGHEFTIGKDTSDKIQRLSKISNMKTICRNRRNCSGCRADKSCTECLYVSGSEEELFCSLMKEAGAEVREFLLMKNTYAAILSESRIIRDASDVRISNSRYSSLYTGKEYGNGESEQYFLIMADSETYCLDGKRNALMRLDSKLFLILEGMMRSADRDSIIRALGEYCLIYGGEAEKIYRSGMHILERTGIIS